MRCCPPCRCRRACPSPPCPLARRAPRTPVFLRRRFLRSETKPSRIGWWRTSAALRTRWRRPRNNFRHAPEHRAFTPMKYALITFGCRVNQADTGEIEAEFLACGGAPATPQDADIVVVNTCSVTSASDQGARQIIRKIARENPGARIIVTGCYATRQPAELAALPGVVQVIPNDRKDFFAEELGLTTAERFGEG